MVKSEILNAFSPSFNGRFTTSVICAPFKYTVTSDTLESTRLGKSCAALKRASDDKNKSGRIFFMPLVWVIKLRLTVKSHVWQFSNDLIAMTVLILRSSFDFPAVEICAECSRNIFCHCVVQFILKRFCQYCFSA